MIFGGKGKAEICGRAGYHSHVIIYDYMYQTSWQIFYWIHVFIYVYTCIQHLKYFIYVRYRYFWVFVRSRMTPKKPIFMNFFTGYEFPHGLNDVIFLWRHFDAVIMTSYFCDVISTPSLWRHIFVTSFWRRHNDVKFLWRHFDAVIMTSYFCDVILTPSLWRHIFVTSFWRRHYDVIFLWRHFDAVIMTSA
jgi:hypothetical protein